MNKPFCIYGVAYRSKAEFWKSLGYAFRTFNEKETTEWVAQKLRDKTKDEIHDFLSDKLNKFLKKNAKGLFGMFKPRWYQQEACDAFWQFVETNHDASRNPVLVLPTGTGKSVIIAYIIQHAVKTWDNIRVLMLTHVGELVKQNAGKLSSIWPEADIGICSATLGHKDTENSIIFGNVQSVAPLLKRDANAFGMRNLIVIDECHMLSEDENSQYRQVIAALKKLRPQMRVLGLSATPYRMKGGYLTEQKNAVFTDIVYDLNSQFERLISEGYLAPVTTLKTKPHVDLTGVGTRAGDYKLDELQKACGDDAMLKNSLVEVVKRSSGRRAWIVFIAGIENCNKCAQLLREMSISAYAVNSSFSAEENATKIEAFRKGEIRCLVSADQLTTGFDVPQVDLIAMLRPTKSPGLYVQMIGRGLRPAEGKKIVLFSILLEISSALVPLTIHLFALVLKRKHLASNRHRLDHVLAVRLISLFRLQCALIVDRKLREILSLSYKPVC